MWLNSIKMYSPHPRPRHRPPQLHFPQSPYQWSTLHPQNLKLGSVLQQTLDKLWQLNVLCVFSSCYWVGLIIFKCQYSSCAIEENVQSNCEINVVMTTTIPRDQLQAIWLAVTVTKLDDYWLRREVLTAGNSLSRADYIYTVQYIIVQLLSQFIKLIS